MTDLVAPVPVDNVADGEVTRRAEDARRTRVVLDTSVLVADPDCFGSMGDVDIVIPLTVVEELDGLKTRPDDVGRSARAALRALEEMRNRAGGTLAHPIPLTADGASGGTLSIACLLYTSPSPRD